MIKGARGIIRRRAAFKTVPLSQASVSEDFGLEIKAFK
jgi:hypothetical protein